ncbi:MAG: hypothetical protein ACYDH4_08645 [Candidatus Cryosericum sp.]
MSYRSPDPADTYEDDHDYFAAQAMNATPEEQDALYAKYLKMTYELPTDEEEAVARMSVDALTAIIASSNGKRFVHMTPHEYALRFAAKMALEDRE